MPFKDDEHSRTAIGRTNEWNSNFVFVFRCEHVSDYPMKAGCDNFEPPQNITQSLKIFVNKPEKSPKGMPFYSRFKCVRKREWNGQQRESSELNGRISFIASNRLSNRHNNIDTSTAYLHKGFRFMQSRDFLSLSRNVQIKQKSNFYLYLAVSWCNTGM